MLLILLIKYLRKQMFLVKVNDKQTDNERKLKKEKYQKIMKLESKIRSVFRRNMPK